MKKQARRKATVRINAMMAEITQLVSGVVVAHLEKEIENEIGRESKRICELREMRSKLEQTAKVLEEMSKKGLDKDSEYCDMNIEFF